MDESRTQARSGGVFGKESEGERNREERSMADYKEFLDSINREAYHAGEYQWEEDGYTVTRTYHYSPPGCHSS